MYIATRYIGRKYTPGEIIREKLPEEEIKWLLEAGAIRKAAPAVFGDEQTDETGGPEDNQHGDPGEDADKAQGDPGEGEDAADEDEIDEEAEALEIDVMDGLVPAKTAKPAPARKSAAKTRGGKAK